MAFEIKYFDDGVEIDSISLNSKEEIALLHVLRDRLAIANWSKEALLGKENHSAKKIIKEAKNYIVANNVIGLDMTATNLQIVQAYIATGVYKNAKTREDEKVP